MSVTRGPARSGPPDRIGVRLEHDRRGGRSGPAAAWKGPRRTRPHRPSRRPRRRPAPTANRRSGRSCSTPTRRGGHSNCQLHEMPGETIPTAVGRRPRRTVETFAHAGGGRSTCRTLIFSPSPLCHCGSFDLPRKLEPATRIPGPFHHPVELAPTSIDHPCVRHSSARHSTRPVFASYSCCQPRANSRGPEKPMNRRKGRTIGPDGAFREAGNGVFFKMSGMIGPGRGIRPMG